MIINTKIKFESKFEKDLRNIKDKKLLAKITALAPNTCVNREKKPHKSALTVCDRAKKDNVCPKKALFPEKPFLTPQNDHNKAPEYPDKVPYANGKDYPKSVNCDFIDINPHD